MKLTQVLNFNKSTKGTHQYTTNEENPVTTSIYIKKDHLPPMPPQSITITVESNDV